MEHLRAYIHERIAVEDRGYSSPCWIWQRHCNPKGYARSKLPPHYRTCKAVYRAAHEAWTGPIPAGFEIDHLCCVTSCVNPEHLEAVTPAENRRRQALHNGWVVGGKPIVKRSRKGLGGWQRQRSHCGAGHEYTPTSCFIRPDGSRRCRICASAAQRARRHGEKAATQENRLGGGSGLGWRPSGVGSQTSIQTKQFNSQSDSRIKSGQAVS